MEISLLRESEFETIVKMMSRKVKYDELDSKLREIAVNLVLVEHTCIEKIKTLTTYGRKKFYNKVVNENFLGLFNKNSYIKESLTDELYDINTKKGYIGRIHYYFSLIRKGILAETYYKSVKNKRIIKESAYSSRRLSIQEASTKIKLFIEKGKTTSNIVLEDVMSTVKDISKSVANTAATFGTNTKKLVNDVAGFAKTLLDKGVLKFIPGLNVFQGGYDVYKLYENWDKISKMTLSDWVEAFRNWLNGVEGIAVQICLALTGVGNIANIIAWGLILIYDVCYMGFYKNVWNWYNIITDAVSLVATGAAATALRPMKTFMAGGSIAQIATTLATKNPKMFLVVQKMVNKIGGAMSTILNSINKAFTTFTQKFKFIGRYIQKLPGINQVQSKIKELITWFNKKFPKTSSNVKKTVSDVRAGTQKHFQGKTGKYMGTTPHGFDVKHVTQKLVATGDKTVTKKVIGKFTKLFIKSKPQETLKKIAYRLAKGGPQFNYDVIAKFKENKPLLGKMLNPNTEIRVA